MSALDSEAWWIDGSRSPPKWYQGLASYPRPPRAIGQQVGTVLSAEMRFKPGHFEETLCIASLAHSEDIVKGSLGVLFARAKALGLRGAGTSRRISRTCRGVCTPNEFGVNGATVSCAYTYKTHLRYTSKKTAADARNFASTAGELKSKFRKPTQVPFP